MSAERPECQYGSNCYRLNPDHLKNWRHEHLDKLLPAFNNDPDNFELTPETIQKYNIKRPDTVKTQLATLKHVNEEGAPASPLRSTKPQSANWPSGTSEFDRRVSSRVVQKPSTINPRVVANPSIAPSTSAESVFQRFFGAFKGGGMKPPADSTNATGTTKASEARASKEKEITLSQGALSTATVSGRSYKPSQARVTPIESKPGQVQPTKTMSKRETGSVSREEVNLTNVPSKAPQTLARTSSVKSSSVAKGDVSGNNCLSTVRPADSPELRAPIKKPRTRSVEISMPAKSLLESQNQGHASKGAECNKSAQPTSTSETVLKALNSIRSSSTSSTDAGDRPRMSRSGTKPSTSLSSWASNASLENEADGPAGKRKLSPSKGPEQQRSCKAMKIGLGSSRPGSMWLRGSLCPVNSKSPKAYFINPLEGLPEDFSQNKDVFLHASSISSYLLPLEKGDELEFILGDRDKEKPMAKKVRIYKYSHRHFNVILEYLETFFDFLESEDRNQVLVETLPCFALWELLGSATYQNQTEFKLYAEKLLRLLSEIIEIGKLSKALLGDVVATVLNGKLFQEDNKVVGLPAMIKMLSVDDYDANAGLLGGIIVFCRTVAERVPRAVRGLLPLVSAFCGLRPSENTKFLLDILGALVTNNSSYLPDMGVWQEMPLIPTTKELAGPLVEEDKHLSPVKINQPYQGTEDYMDTYFRLLRAETFAAIQRGIKQLKTSQLDPRDMNVYFNVALAGYEIHNSSFSLALQFKPARAVSKWEASPQLMFGNLVCISPNKRFDEVIWATVSNRDPKLLASSQIIMLEPIDYNNRTIREIMTSLQAHNGAAVMVESPTYFQSLKPVLDSLKCFDMDNFPLQNEVVKATPNPDAPHYIELAGSLDTSAIVQPNASHSSVFRGLRGAVCNIGGQMRMHDFLQMVASASNTMLEASQCEALVHAFKNRLAIIQGPPGCGKTFVGVKIVQLLLSLTPQLTKPVLLLTYKNHALDEFLKAMLEFCEKEDVVRIGGRSKEPDLEECNLHSVMKNYKVVKALFNEIQEARNDIESLTSEMKAKSGLLDSSSHLTHQTLLEELTEEQLTSLLTDAGWNKTNPPVYRVNSKKYADKQWISNMLVEIGKCFDGSVKSFLLQCIETGVPKPESNESQQLPRHCFSLFLQALNIWLPDRKELAKLKAFQGQFIQEVYTVEEHVEKRQDDKKKKKNAEDDGDGDYDEEEVAAMLESRLSAVGGDARRRMDNLVIFESVKNKSSNNVAHLSDYPPEMESSASILSVQNLWTLSEIERMKFLHSLLIKRSSQATEEFNTLLLLLERARNRHRELETHKKLKVLTSKKIVGVTITGASIHHDLLHLMGPSIVIVEEAAEILEPSLMAALTPNIEHLILIGDHQQLKPQVDTYKLTREYHFNVSLMERLIRSGFPYKTLRKQNRMRPEFAALLHDIYPALENNYERVSKNAALTCIGESMFFWSHDDPERKERTFTNEKEANRIVSLVLYLLKNGVNSSEITVLSAYLGQTKLLRQKIRSERRNSPQLFDEGTSNQSQENIVQVQTIDMFQGDENKYVIVSLVRSNEDGKIGFLRDINRRCVAQSRAKCGMYFVGNVDTFRKKETCWRTLITGMQDKGCVGRAIPLQCWKHKKLSTYPAVNANDVQEVVQDSTKVCKLKCGDQMPCNIQGHICERPCFPKHIHTACLKRVEDTFPGCGHKVTRKCCENLSDLSCETKLNVQLKCGHPTVKKCFQKTENLVCTTMVDYMFPGCGHPSASQKKCSEPIAWKCHHKENIKLACGHPDVPKECWQRIEDVKCPMPCKKTRKCGHPCANNCGDDCNRGDCKACAHRYEMFRKSAKKKKEELEKKLKEGFKGPSLKTISPHGDAAAEYQKVDDQVMKFIQPMHNWTPTITKIERITNLKLEMKFEEAKLRAFGDHVDIKFHGTSDEGVKGISESGFRMPDQNPPPDKRGMYGQGIYFATDSSKSAQNIYTKGSCKLLLCQVLLGKSKVVRASDYSLNKDRLHKERYDSVYAPRGTAVQNDEFVIFDPDQALPQYIIHFSTYLGYKPPSQMLQGAQLIPPTGQPFFRKNVSASRIVDPNDPFENYYRLAVCHFLSHRKSQNYDVNSVDIVINRNLEKKFEAKKAEFKNQKIPCGEILAYHGTKKSSIDSILTSNLDWTRFARGQKYGRGNYFSEFPDVSIGYGDGLLLCRILTGKEYVNNDSGNIPPGYNSKKVLLSSGAGHGFIAATGGSNVCGEMVIIEEPDQILPYFVIHRK